MAKNSNFDENADNWSLYPYDPVKPLPIVFACLIFLLGLYNIWQNFFKYKWKKFAFIMTWASAVWVAGFVCRALSQYQTRNIGLYIAQYVMILLGPPLYAASETFILGRILAYVPYHTIIHPSRVLSTFLILSTLIEVLSANGAARLSNWTLSEAEQKTAYGLVEAALILQAVLELGFMSLASYLWLKCRQANTLPRNVRTMLTVIIFTSAMMLIRCIVRAVEVFAAQACHSSIAVPNSSCAYIITHEWPVWVLEVANITLFVIALTIWTPGRFLPHSNKIYLDRYDGTTERVGPGFSKADKRPLIVTILDPFNLVGIISGHGTSVTPFWEERHPEYVGQEIPKAASNSAVVSDEEASRKESV